MATFRWLSACRARIICSTHVGCRILEIQIVDAKVVWEGRGSCWDRIVSDFPDDGSLVKTTSIESMTIKPLSQLNQLRLL